MKLAKAAVIAGSLVAGSSAVYGLVQWDKSRAQAELSQKRHDHLGQVAGQLKQVDSELSQYAASVDAEPKREIELYNHAKSALDDTVAALRDMHGGKLQPAQVGESMTKFGALPAYSRVYDLLSQIGDAGWQAENGPQALAAKQATVAEIKKGMAGTSLVDGVCSQAFGQDQGKILLNCMDMRLARPVVLMVDPSQYSRSSYPLNGKFPVIDRGVKQYTITHANGLNTWQSTEMVPTFEVVSADAIQADRQKMEEAEQSVIEEQSRTQVAAATLHNALKAFGSKALGQALPKSFTEALGEYKRLCSKSGQTDEDAMMCQMAGQVVLDKGDELGLDRDVVQSNYDRVGKEIQAAVVWVKN